MERADAFLFMMVFSKQNGRYARNVWSETSLKLVISKIVNIVLLTFHVFVSPASCGPDPSQSLSYDLIYNTTDYAQLKPYSIPKNRMTNVRFNNSTRLDKEAITFGEKYDINNNQLLVGFPYDPFRLSIPAADYLKGVRSVESPRQWSQGDRGKRGVVHLYNMLTCATGCDPLSYKGYGCYCGFLGEGRPTDGIDNCCRLHDECYERFRCPFYTVYFQPYYWACHGGEPLCALENRLVRHGVNACAGRLCDCDRRLALCVRRFACPAGRPLCTSSPLRLLQNLLMAK